MAGTSPKPTAWPLEPVRRFINTLDIEAGTDALQDGRDLRRWLVEAGLLAQRAPVSSDDLRVARELREALREAAAANHDHTEWPAPVAEVLNRVSGRANLAVTFTGAGGWVFEVRAGAVEGALGHLVVLVAEAMNDGTWTRLKICPSDTCRWAFHDESRAGNGRWCTMRLCGNRAKQETWRTRAAATRRLNEPRA